MADADGGAIVRWATARAGQTVGRGECWDLAEQALLAAGARSSRDFGPVGPGVAYVWGRAIPLAQARPGDILQYANYVATITVDGETTYNFDAQNSITIADQSTNSRRHPHHTSVVVGTPGGGQLDVYEQNVDRGSGMERTVGAATIYVTGNPGTNGTRRHRVLIDRAWAERVRAIYSDPDSRRMVDDIMRRFGGRTVEAVTTGRTSVTVTGTVRAYRPQAR